MSRPPSDEFDAGAGETPALLWGGDKMVVTTAIRASAGTRFNAMLQPTQPARRAVGGRAAVLRSPNLGGRGSTALPMMAEGGKAKLATWCG